MTITPYTGYLRLTLAAAAMAGVLTVTGCVNGPRLVTPEPPPIPEGSGTMPDDNVAVLSPGQQIVADTAEGHIKIEAGPGMRRVFNWDGLRRGAIVKARDESFAGGDTKGISFDGQPKVWADADGITQLRYEEGRRNFENIDDAMIWMQIRRLYYTYADDGLVIGWKRDDDTLHVELWQFYINGSKPASLPDSKSSRIAQGPLKVEPQKMYPHLVFADGHTEPYTTDTASKYSNRRSGSSAQSSDCNWFERVFGRCTASSTDSDDTVEHATDGDTTNNTTLAAESGNTSTNDGAANSASADTTADGSAQSQTDSDTPQATISGKVVNIRSRPTTDSDVLLQAKRGDTVTVLKEERDWRYIEFDDGRKGWVANFLLDHQE